MTDRNTEALRRIWRLARRLFGGPFEALPRGFGDPVPPELRIFETQGEEFQHHPVGKLPPRAIGDRSAKHARRVGSPERN